MRSELTDEQMGLRSYLLNTNHYHISYALTSMKVGIIRCMMTEDMCPGTTDFSMAKEGKGAFKESGPVDIVGFVTCGGCPGKRAIPRARMMVDRGAEAIVFASCITRGNPIGYPCPHYADMRDCIIKAVGPGIEIIEWTH